jgi:hypothetical protein
VSLARNFTLPCARLGAALAAIIVIVVAAPAAASAATRLVAPVGSDSGDCTIAPCASLGYAYNRAVQGDVITVAPGVYGEQRVPNGSKALTFAGGAGVIVRQLFNEADNVTYDGINVNAGGVHTTGAAFELDGNNVTVRNSSVGNVVDEKAMLAMGFNQTIDNVTFHDAIMATDGIHMECLYAIGVDGFTLRNSTFRDCAIMDVLFTYGTWWSPKPPAYGNVRVENNVFAHPERTNNRGWHYYSMYVGDTGPNGSGGDPMRGWIVRNNTFESPARISSSGGSAGTVWSGNLGSWDCKNGIAFSANVGKACGASDKRVEPASSNESRVAAFGWLNPSVIDFRLKPGSPAINVGQPGDSPATDRLGLARDGRPDAGAYEFGARAPGGAGPGTGPGGGGAGLSILFARLRPRVICVQPRRGCPGVSRLRMRLSGGARVAVRIKRLRSGKRPRRVRAFGFDVSSRGARRIKARRLGKGRYRVVVRARAAGRQTRARTLRLRVR